VGAGKVLYFARGEQSLAFDLVLIACRGRGWGAASAFAKLRDDLNLQHSQGARIDQMSITVGEWHGGVGSVVYYRGFQGKRHPIIPA
jgi:hypothetical protein